MNEDETFTCWHCGNEYSAETHLGWCDDRGDACDYCEHDVTEICGLCGELFPEDHSGLVVVIMPSERARGEEAEPDDGAAMRPGVYLVRSWPIYTAPLCGAGAGWVNRNSLQRVADVPAAAAAFEEGVTIGQHVCSGCARPYVLAAALPLRATRHGWEAAGRSFVRREDAERWREDKVDRRMEQMLGRLRYRWNATKCPVYTRKQRRWRHEYRRRNGANAE